MLQKFLNQLLLCGRLILHLSSSATSAIASKGREVREKERGKNRGRKKMEERKETGRRVLVIQWHVFHGAGNFLL